MPTSATGISIRNGIETVPEHNSVRPARTHRPAPRPPRRPARHRSVPDAGFSLLELLVVVTIIAILAGAAVLSMGTLGSDREIQREAERLSSLIDLLTEEAVMASHDYGVLFSESGYRFYVYDYQTLTWNVPPGDRLLAEHSLRSPLQLTLRLDDRAAELNPDFELMDRNEQPEPQVIVYASGQVTPFAVSFFRDLAGGHFSLEVAFDGTTTISQDGFDAS